MFIRSPRLFLRPVFPEDWRDIHRGIADERVVRMLARAPWPYHEQHAQEYCALAAHPGEMRFSITLPGPHGAPVIGQIGLQPDKYEPEPDLGYWVAPAYQRKGYCSEAVAAVLEVARAIGIPKVVSGHFLDNPASGKVLRKAGFTETGEIKPTFSLARREQVLCRRYAIDLVESPADSSPDTRLHAA